VTRLSAVIELRFHAGTLEVRGVPRGSAPSLPPACAWDPRTDCHRAPAAAYADVVLELRRGAVEYRDDARAYDELEDGARALMEARPYQREALTSWTKARGRGVVVLPTGAGKTHVATLAIDARRRSALVVAPTLDLVRQWYDVLRRAFGVEVGVVGGGDHELRPLTVTTYDSAWIHMEHFGNRFGMVVFDECHHLPGESYAMAARSCLAPFRLGLTATPERADGRESELDELVGAIVYRRDIVELSGRYLAEYETRRIAIHLSSAERAEYESERRIYLDFLRSHGITMSHKSGWNDFIKRSAGSEKGQRAMRAYRRQREIAFAAPGKLDQLAFLLETHCVDRMLVFTMDNATAYRISRRFLIPAITHQTKVTERSRILERLAAGEYSAVVTSKVLNEGVDVPEANVAVVISGSGSVREHVQRLGRILRPREGKHAVLYELVSADTAESWTSERRRDHVAYR
jgi:superfamily II DNA or RNA helicase